jgi:uncharacterized protein (DUF302 family)
MKYALLILALLTFPVFAADGLVALKSPHAAKATMDRLEAALKDKGLTIFARIDHATGAAKIGKQLRATELLIFMDCSQTVGIDLPLKALVWQDEAGQVRLGYNDPAFLAARHGIAQCPATAGLRKALAGFAQQAVSK